MRNNTIEGDEFEVDLGDGLDVIDVVVLFQSLQGGCTVQSEGIHFNLEMMKWGVTKGGQGESRRAERH